jgi:hypothetical protein
MRFALLSVLIFLVSGIFFGVIPVQAAGGLIPCDGPDCRACDLVSLGQKLLTWFIGTMAAVIVLIFAWGGMKMVMSGGSSEGVSEAKGMMTNSVIGFLILLGAWLIVDTVLKTVISEDAVVQKKLGTWNKIECIALPERVTTPDGDSVTVVGGAGGTTGRAGSCTPARGGPCGTDALQGTFGSAASQASQICLAESSANPAILSASDRLGNRNGQNKNGDPFSVGLFQINLTYHKLDGCGSGGATLDCPSAFRGRNYDATIVNRTLYNDCVKAAQNPTCNANNARKIYNGSGSRWKDWSTAAKCGL